MSDSITEVKRSPLLGEHTEEILTKVLGYSAKELAEIKTLGRDHAAGEAGARRRRRSDGSCVVPANAGDPGSHRSA